MNRILIIRFLLVVFCVCALTACQSDSKNVTGAETLSEKTTAVMRSKSASIDAPRMLLRKPLAPISIDYEIIGTPIIGIPLSINVKISSTLNKPIRMNYRIIDTTSLMFVDAQAQSISVDFGRCGGICDRASHSCAATRRKTLSECVCRNRDRVRYDG
jgi:hypothetical protein